MQIINDNGELKVKLTKREAKQIVAELEAHLAWFEAVAIPFYAKVFAPSNTACTGRKASRRSVKSKSIVALRQ
jgi:hypothetical protein